MIFDFRQFQHIEQNSLNAYWIRFSSTKKL